MEDIFTGDASSGEVLDPFPIPSLDAAAAEVEEEEANPQDTVDPTAAAEDVEVEAGAAEIGMEVEDDTDVEEEAGLDPEEDEETLPQLPAQQPQPQHQRQQQQHQELELDIPDLPEDGIVVLLPGIGSPTGPAPDMLLDAGEQPAALPPIPGLDPITDWDVEVDTDVDSFAVTISPANMLKIFRPAATSPSSATHLILRTLMCSKIGSILRNSKFFSALNQNSRCRSSSACSSLHKKLSSSHRSTTPLLRLENCAWT